MLLGFTIRLMYTNNMFSCIYNLLEIKISSRLNEQMFVYVLLAAVTLLAEPEFLYIVGSVEVNFLSYRYRADKSTIFGMRGLWSLTINSGRGARLKYL